MAKKVKEISYLYFNDENKALIRKYGGVMTNSSGILGEHYFRIRRDKQTKKQIIEHDEYIMDRGLIKNIITLVHKDFKELWETINKKLQYESQTLS